MSDPVSDARDREAVRWVAPDVGGSTVSDGPMTVGRLEALQRSAYEEAYAQGLEAGRRDGTAELAKRAAELDTLLAALNEPFRDLDEAVEHLLVELATGIARQLLRRELATDPELIVGVVREAVSLLPVSTRDIEIHLHPEDAEVVRSAFGETGSAFAWRLIEDPVIARGGLQVVTETSLVDARLEQRLENILATLAGEAGQTDG